MSLKAHSLFSLVLAGIAGSSSAALGQGSPFPAFTQSNPFPANAEGRRVALGDVNGDSYPDLLLDGRLLLNDGSGTFTWASGSGLTTKARAAVFLDFDRDGDLDVFTTGGPKQRDRLYRNDTPQTASQQVRFTHVSNAAGIRHQGFPGGEISAGDLNRDGFPDLYVSNRGAFPGSIGRLYLSDGSGGYRNTPSQMAGGGQGRGVSMADYDLDGDIDLHVGDPRLSRNTLWTNQHAQTGALRLIYDRGGRDARFFSPTPPGVAVGSAWGDLDNDGDLDLVSANRGVGQLPGTTQVELNTPGRGLSVVQAGSAWQPSLGLTAGSCTSPTLFDADNDGDLDLHVTRASGGSRLYRNRVVESGRLSFADRTRTSAARTGKSFGAAVADVDGDGDLDLVVGAAKGAPVLLTNEAPASARCVRVRLIGRRSDTQGFGATATLSGGGAKRQVRQLTLNHGTSNQSEPVLHFGVGTAKGPLFTVRVAWPSGAVSTHKLAADTVVHEVHEPKTAVPAPNRGFFQLGR